MTTAQCPHCGAALALDGKSAVVVCAYCKTSCQVQRGGHAPPPQPIPNFIAGAPPPPPALIQPVIHVPKGSPAGAIVTCAVLFTVLTAGIGVAVFVVAARPGSSSSSAGPDSVLGGLVEETFQFSTKALLFDVDGDGTLDAIGENAGYAGGEKHWIAAFDGKDGAPLWKTEPLEKSIFSEGRMGLADDLIVTVDTLGKVRTFSAKTGKPKWTANISERAETLCAAEGFVGVPTLDKGFVAFDDKTGKADKNAKREACKPIATTEIGREAGASIVGWADFDDVGLPDSTPHFIAGYSAHNALVPDDAKVRYLLAEKQPGSGVPTIIAHDDKKQLWVTELPMEQPLDAESFSGNVVAGYGQGRFVAVYERKNDQGLRLSCLDAETGKHEWDVAVPKNPGDVPSGIAISKQAVFFTTWTHLHVYALKSGKHKFTIGQF